MTFLEVVNVITVDDLQIAKAVKEPNLKIILGEERISPRKVKKFEVQCVECHHNFPRKSLTAKIMFEAWRCFSCNQKGERNSFYGRRHSDEMKKKLSEERKGVWCVGEANAMYGVNVWEYVSPEKAEEMRAKNSKESRERESNPFRDIRSFIGEDRWKAMHDKRIETVKNFSPEKKAEISKKLSEAAKRTMGKDPEAYREMKARAGRASSARAPYAKTKLEEKVEKWLTENNIDYVYSAIMSNKTGSSYQFDFLIKEKRVLVECHGKYWHADPRFYEDKDLNEMQIAKRKRDLEKSEYAVENNFKLLVIWEYDVNKNDFSALEELL